MALIDLKTVQKGDKYWTHDGELWKVLGTSHKTSSAIVIQIMGSPNSNRVDCITDVEPWRFQDKVKEKHEPIEQVDQK